MATTPDPASSSGSIPANSSAAELTRDVDFAPDRSAVNQWRWLVIAGYLSGLAVLVFTPIAWKLNRFTVLLYNAYHRFTWPGTAIHLPGNPRPVPEDFGFLLNVLLFLPVGWLVVTVLRRHVVVAGLMATLLSGGIELAQGTLLPYRDSSVSDVVSNGLGGLIGAALTWWLRGRIQAKRAAAFPPSAAPGREATTDPPDPSPAK